MTPQCLSEQMAKLRQEFSPKNFTPEREEMIARAVRGLPDSSFEKIVAHFIANRAPNQPPMPKDFNAAAIAETYALGGGQVRVDKPPEPIKCHWCNDGGVVEVERIKSGKEYLMRCTCEAGAKSFRSDFPFWSDSFAPYFRLHKMFGERALKWKPKRQFDRNDPLGSLSEKVQEWQLKVNLSRVLWGEMEALKAARAVEEAP